MQIKLKMKMRHYAPTVDSWGLEYIHLMHLEDMQEAGGLIGIYGQIQTRFQQWHCSR